MTEDELIAEMGLMEVTDFKEDSHLPAMSAEEALIAEMGLEEVPAQQKTPNRGQDISVGNVLEDMYTATANAGKALYGGVKEAITGNERSTERTDRLEQYQQMPEFQELSSLIDPAVWATTVGSLFTGSKGEFELIKANFPDMETDVDEKGNWFVKSKNGKWYANKPGFGPTDVPAALASAIPVSKVIQAGATATKSIPYIAKAMEVASNFTKGTGVLRSATVEGLDAVGRLAMADTLGAEPTALDYALDTGLGFATGGLSRKTGKNLSAREGTLKKLDQMAVKANEHGLSLRKGGQGIAGGQQAVDNLRMLMNDPRTQQDTLIYMDSKGLGFDENGHLVKTLLNVEDEAGSAGKLVHRPRGTQEEGFSVEEMDRMRQTFQTDPDRVAAAKELGAKDYVDPLNLIAKGDKQGRHVMKASQDRAVAGDKMEDLGTAISEELQSHGADVNLGQLSKDTLSQMKGVSENFKKDVNKRYARLYDTKRGGIDPRTEVDIPSTRALILKEKQEQMPRLQAGEELVEEMDPKITAIEEEILADFRPRKTKITEQLSDFGKWAGLDPDISEGSVGRTFATLDKTRKKIGGMMADQTVSNYNKSKLTELYKSVSNDVESVLNDMVAKGQITEKTRKLYDKTHAVVVNQKMFDARKERLFGKDELAPLKAKLDVALKDATSGHGGALWDSIIKDVPKNLRPKAIMSILHDSLDSTSGGFVNINKLHTMWSDLSQNKPLMAQLAKDIGPERMRGLRNVGIMSEAIYQSTKKKSTKTKSYMVEIANQKASRIMGVLTGLGVATGTVIGSSAIAHGSFSQSKSYAATGIGGTLKKWLSGGNELRADYVTNMLQSPEFTKLLQSDMNDKAIHEFTKKARVMTLAKQRDKSISSIGLENKIKAGIRAARNYSIESERPDNK